jgi:hypothetical protein
MIENPKSSREHKTRNTQKQSLFKNQPGYSISSKKIKEPIILNPKINSRTQK